MMDGIVGIFMIAFGILWTVLVAKVNTIFAIIGILWTVMAVVRTVYSFKNAIGKNRYSAYDITECNEEPDSFNEHFGNQESDTQRKNNVDNKFCPYCGTAVESDFEFCNNCGKKLP